MSNGLGTPRLSGLRFGNSWSVRAGQPRSLQPLLCCWRGSPCSFLPSPGSTGTPWSLRGRSCVSTICLVFYQNDTWEALRSREKKIVMGIPGGNLDWGSALVPGDGQGEAVPLVMTVGADVGSGASTTTTSLFIPCCQSKPCRCLSWGHHWSDMSWPQFQPQVCSLLDKNGWVTSMHGDCFLIRLYCVLREVMNTTDLTQCLA